MPPETVSEPEAPSRDNEVEDYTKVLSNGIRIRVRVVHKAQAVFLVADAKPGPHWAIRDEGMSLLWNGVGTFLEEEPAESWCFVTDTGLLANVAEPVALCLVQLLEEVLSNPEWTAVLGMDPALDPPVPFNPDEGAPVRVTLTPFGD